MLGVVEIGTPKEKHNKIFVSLCITVYLCITLILRQNLWAQHYSRLYSLYFSDLGQTRADPRSVPSHCPPGALCRGWILSGAALSQCSTSLQEWNEAAILGLLKERPTSGRMVCHWLLCPESLGPPSEGTLVSVILCLGCFHG